jgi:hypothetical protein
VNFLNVTKEKTVGLYLTGGLGNQLFQLAAAISIAQGREIEILEKPGRPRLNMNNDPEMFSLSVTRIADVRRIKKDSYLLRKSTGYLLRSGIWPGKFERIPLIGVATKLTAAMILSMRIKKLYFPMSSSDVGYSDLKFQKILERYMNPFLIGYCQTFVWADTVKSQLEKLSINQVGPDLQSLRFEAKSMAPIIIHIRRGDYKAETTFGLPGENYYKAGMDIIDRSHSSHPIWVFSDDVSEAKRVLGWLPSERIKYISDVDQQSSASLMAMRLGCAYIIANSTFSWWGAFLSETNNPLVVAPNPWFIGQKEPAFLIPKDWIRIQC